MFIKQKFTQNKFRDVSEKVSSEVILKVKYSMPKNAEKPFWYRASYLVWDGVDSKVEASVWKNANNLFGHQVQLQ